MKTLDQIRTRISELEKELKLFNNLNCYVGIIFGELTALRWILSEMEK